jgi:hypothetical protein
MFTDDQDIDHELRAALNVEPSAGFGAGVRRRIETNRPQRGGRSVWFAAAAAVLLVIAGAWLALPRGRTIEPPPAAVAVSKPSATSQGDVPKSVVQPNSTAQQALGPKPERGPVANVAAREQKPEVLVPAGQLALIQRLLRQANSGQVEVPAGDSPSTPPVELVVTPVFIAPIAVAGAEPGGGTSPGPKGLQ